MTDREVLCPYCGNSAELVDSAVIFGRSYGMVWRCEPCDARVGCHGTSNVPKGTLADPALRGARRDVHAVFDPIWRDGEMLRFEAYAWLAKKLGLPGHECHVARFDLGRCAVAIRACKARTA